MALSAPPPHRTGTASAWAVVLVVAAGLAAVLLARIDRGPLQPYGVDAAQYIEHLARLETLQAAREVRGPGDWQRLLREVDNAFPPLLHLLTLPAGAVSGHRAEDVLWSGLFWLFLLAASMGGVGLALSRRPGVGLAVATAVGLLPAAHAFATRYYYDLPMTALLWASVAVAMLMWDRRPVVGGVLAGLVWFAACLLKWLALPFGVPMLLGAAMGAQFRRRLAPLLLATVVCGCLVGLYLYAVGPHHSLRAMLNDVAADPVGDTVSDPQAAQPTDSGWQRELPWSGLQPLSTRRVVFYPLRLITSVFSPGLGLILIAMVGVWWRGGRVGMPLVAGVVLGHGGFLLFGVRPLDDRFVLVGAPVLVLAACLGWSSLGASRQRGIAALVVVLGGLVALDFHTGFTLPGAESPVQLIEATLEPGVELRGLGLADSVEKRGWSRWHPDEGNHTAAREQLWKTLAHCSAMKLRVAAEDPIVSEGGDLFWFKYRALYAWLEEEPPTPRVMEDAQPAFFGPPECRKSTPGESELGVGSARRGEEPTRPPCVGEDWLLEGVLPLVELSRFAAIWTPPGQSACAPLQAEGGALPSEREAATVLETTEPGGHWTCESISVDGEAWDPCTCNKDYLAFPERAARWADPAESCEALHAELVAHWNDGWNQPRPPIPDLAPEDLNDAVIDATNIRFLLEGDAELPKLDRRPLTVSVLGEQQRDGHRELELEFVDPFVGSFQGLLLLPEGEGPFPAVLALPGHNESAAIHRDQRSGDRFVQEGYATLLLTFRAYDTGLAEHQATLHLLCHGFSILGLRVYEALLGLRYLAHRGDVDGARVAVIGHSGGSVVTNLLIRVRPDLLKAAVSDLTAIYFNVGPPLDDESGHQVGDETHYALARLAANINDFETAAVPVFPVEYGYSRGLGGAMRFLDRHLKGMD